MIKRTKPAAVRILAILTSATTNPRMPDTANDDINIWVIANVSTTLDGSIKTFSGVYIQYR